MGILEEIWNKWAPIAERVGEHPIMQMMLAPIMAAHEMSHYWMARILGVPVKWRSRTLVSVQCGAPWKTGLSALTPVGIGAVLMTFFVWTVTAGLVVTLVQLSLVFVGIAFSWSWLVMCQMDIKNTYILIKTGEWPYLVLE